VFASQPNNTAEPVPCPPLAEKKEAAAADAKKKKK
jgi:hypothetical protein